MRGSPKRSRYTKIYHCSPAVLPRTYRKSHFLPALRVGGVEIVGVAKGYGRAAAAVDQFQQIPETAMENRVAAGDIEVRRTVHPLRHTADVIERTNQPFPRRFYQRRVSLGEDIAVFAPLVALVGYVPLKGKILFHCLLIWRKDTTKNRHMQLLMKKNLFLQVFSFFYRLNLQNS